MIRSSASRTGSSIGDLVRTVAQRAIRLLPVRTRAALRRAFRPDGVAESWAVRLDDPSTITWPDPTLPSSTSSTPVVRTASGPDIRCLLVTDSIDAGGVDELVAFLAQQLPARGFVTAVLLAPSKSTRTRGAAFGAVARRIQSEGVEIIYDPDQAVRADAVRAWAPDVIAMHAGPTWPVELAAELGVPVVETLHGMHNLNGDPEVGVLSRLDLLAAVSSVSETVALQFAAVAPHAAPPTVIPNGVDRSRIGRVDRDRARTAMGIGAGPLVVSMARYSLQKNSYALLSAFDEIADRVPDARLVICGRVDDASYLGRMIKLRKSMRHGSSVRLRDNLERTDVLLAASDCLVLDSFFEGWALAPMEALGSGIPVVSSDVGGAREQLRDGVPRGVLVPHPLGDPLTADWDAMARARFIRQPNRGDLVDAVAGVITGEVELGTRSEISEYALDRFRESACVDAHAALLAAAASGSLAVPAAVRAG